MGMTNDVTAGGSSPPAAGSPPGATAIDAPVIEAGPEVFANDGDSAIETGSVLTSTASLRESIFDYRKHHGRPYQTTEAGGEYWAPVDEEQNEGLDLIHAVMLMNLEDRLFLAPIPDTVGRVLDIGTGTGIWCIDFADQFPNADVTGTDISAIQPKWVPPNCRFVIDDLVLEWTWPADHFDFIHLRSMYGCVPDWKELYAKVFKHLKPGGWFEDVESDVLIESDHVDIPKDHIFYEWADMFYTGGEKMGRRFDIAKGHFLRDLMLEVGFVDVVERKIKIPLHGWPKDPRLKQAGLLAQAALDQSLDGFSMFMLTQVHGRPRDESVVRLAALRKETRKASNFPWYLATVVYGRKPDAPAAGASAA